MFYKPFRFLRNNLSNPLWIWGHNFDILNINVIVWLSSLFLTSFLWIDTNELDREYFHCENSEIRVRIGKENDKITFQSVVDERKRTPERNRNRGHKTYEYSPGLHVSLIGVTVGVVGKCPQRHDHISSRKYMTPHTYCGRRSLRGSLFEVNGSHFKPRYYIRNLTIKNR